MGYCTPVRGHILFKARRASRSKSSGRRTYGIPCLQKSICRMSIWHNVRHSTPGVSDRIHLNAAGCSLQSLQTKERVLTYLEKEQSRGGYEHALDCQEELNTPYTELATLLNCCEEEIAIVSSATEGWLQIIQGLSWGWTKDDCIVTSESEYGTNYLTYLQMQKRIGIGIEVVPETEEYDIDLEHLEKVLMSGGGGNTKKPVLISITHIPTSSGRVYDVAGVGRLAKKYGVPYLLDACQSVGHICTDVQAIQCDFLSGTGRKFLRAPRGTGFLYCSKEYLDAFEPASIDVASASWTNSNDYKLGGTSQRFEKYEMSYAARVGFGVALRECNDIGIHTIEKRILDLAEYLRNKLEQDVPGLVLRDKGTRLCGIVSFTVQGVSADALYALLQSEEVSVSVSRITSSRLDFEKRHLEQVVRASVHVYNEAVELDRFVSILRHCVIQHNNRGLGYLDASQTSAERD